MAKNKRNKLIENWKVVMFSLLGATTFWFFNALNKDYSALIKYPIEFEFLDDSVIVIEPLPKHVSIDVSSGGWNLFKETLWFSVEPIKIELDNPEEIRYLTRSTIYPTIAEHLKSLSINYLITDTLKINVERKKTKGVKLKVDSINIPLANNHRITSKIHLLPDTVLITGPESVINFMESEYYITLADNKLSNSYDDMVAVPLPFEEYMSSKPAKVNLKFQIDRFDKETIRVPVEQVNFPENIKIDLSDTLVSIRYDVARSKKESIKASQFNVIVDYKLLQPDSTISPILIFYPEDALDVTLVTSKLKVSTRRAKTL
jgi:hypothetical protein